jgi:phage shock protein E
MRLIQTGRLYRRRTPSANPVALRLHVNPTSPAPCPRRLGWTLPVPAQFSLVKGRGLRLAGRESLSSATLPGSMQRNDTEARLIDTADRPATTAHDRAADVRRARAIGALLIVLLLAGVPTSVGCRSNHPTHCDMPLPTTVTPNSYQHVDPAGAEALLANHSVVVLDIRTPAEFQAGHLEGARNIDFNAPGFAQALGALDRSTTYLVHCASGGRSTRSLPTFAELRFRNVIHLDGGIRGWLGAGKPVVR